MSDRTRGIGAVIELSERELALADAVAARVLEALERRPAASVAPPRLVSAAELAVVLGTTRDCVYRHAAELGGQRLGAGERGRLRFDPAVALERWTAQPPEPRPAPRTPTSRRRAVSDDVPLLPIRR